MDEKPFLPLKSSADILFFYDYTDADSFLSNWQIQPTATSLRDINCQLSQEKPTEAISSALDKNYKSTTLIAFSYGVFMAAFLKDILPPCDLKIAINGTLKPVDEKFGIPEKIFKLTLENMTANTAYKFREKLFDNKDHLFIFNENLPVRDLESSLTELSALKKYFFENKEVDFEYDKVLIGNSDKVIPVKNQKNYWQSHQNQHLVEGGHFLFYNVDDFSELTL